MHKRIELPDAERRALAARIEKDLRTIRRAGHLSDLHESYVPSVAWSLTFALPAESTLGELEYAAASLLATDSILRSPMPGSADDLKAKAEAKAEAGPSRAEYARMTAEQRLEAINAKNFREQEKAERALRKAEVESNKFDASKPTTAAERLREANSFQERATPVEAPEPEAVNDSVAQLTPAQTIGMADVWKKLGIDLYGDRPRRKSAGQRLSEANVAAYEAAKKKAKAK
jgi:hypothetical protein